MGPTSPALLDLTEGCLAWRSYLLVRSFGSSAYIPMWYRRPANAVSTIQENSVRFQMLEYLGRGGGMDPERSEN
jgi:hypothetical protein